MMDLQRNFSRLGLMISLMAAFGCARPSYASSFGSSSSWRQASSTLAPQGPVLALAGDREAMEQAAPQMVQVRVRESDLRRMQWGYALTIVGIFGIITGGVGMVFASSTADKDKGPKALANPALARKYRRQHRAGIAMLFSGLGVGISGMIAGPLLIRSARKRAQAHWERRSSLSWLFSGQRPLMP